VAFTSLTPAKNAAPATAANAASTAAAAETTVSKPDKKTVSEGLGSMALSFEENGGQTDERVRYLARSPFYTLFLTDKEGRFQVSQGKRRQDRPRRFADEVQ
jgi:hypothetical protein